MQEELGEVMEIYRPIADCENHALVTDSDPTPAPSVRWSCNEDRAPF